MDGSSFKEIFFSMLGESLSQKTAEAVTEKLDAAGATVQTFELLVELQEISSKLTNRAIEVLPEVLHRCDTQTVVPWLDLTVTLANMSGAVTLKYLNESPQILGILNTSGDRQQVLLKVLEISDGGSQYAANCAFEFFRKTPELFFADPNIDLTGWAEVGRELTEWNQVLGIEFFRECPNIAEVLPLNEVRSWIAFGAKLITQNSLGKPDYIGILEFFRTSPALLKEISAIELRSRVVALGSTLADHSPEASLKFLGEIPLLLKALPSTEWQVLVLQYGALLADLNGGVTLAYLRRCPEVISITVGSDQKRDAFEIWFRGGMEILEYSPEGARAFYALETTKALDSIEKAMNGVTLRQAVRSLKMFAQMISGEVVLIESLPQNESIARIEKTSQGMRIRLPMVMNQHVTQADNLRSYTVMVAHEVGHLEFGTYRLARNYLQTMMQKVAVRYGKKPQDFEHRVSLTDLFSLYPQKGVIQDLWTILEDSRVDFLLQQEYPGFRDDLAKLAKVSVSARSYLHGMTVREMVLDALLLYLTQGPEVPTVQDSLKPVIKRTLPLAQSILHANASGHDAIQLADKIYQVMDEMIGTYEISLVEPLIQTDDSEADLGAGPRAAEETTRAYRSITNFSYRGEMNPDFVEGETDSNEGPAPSDLERSNSQEFGGVRAQQSSENHEPTIQELGEDLGQDYGDAETVQNQVLGKHWAVKGTGQGELPVQEGEAQAYLYPEWDGEIQDYRLKWCRVLEQLGKEGSQDFAQSTLEKYAASIRLLRRYFETIRPTMLRKVHGYESGEELDLDAAIRRVVDRHVGAEPSDDRIYLRREKRERQVAVAFLVDISGSTGRQLESGVRRVIDVEKEALVLLVEALDAIGDQYALYGFSGQGRDHVDFLVLKDFEDTSRYQVWQRIEAMAPLRQNRDGAAIRHATQKLLSCSAKHRLLVLLSDGRPLDGGYADEYALEDTKMALREARQYGISPFCLTIDREATGYLKRMYGDIQYLVLDDVVHLPEQLPRTYQRLTR